MVAYLIVETRDSLLMSKFARLIEFKSAQFPRTALDDELINHEHMYGYALSAFIGDELGKRGHEVDYLVEDWGWFCFLVSSDPTLAYGVSAENGNDEFLIQFIPDKPYVRKMVFKKIDVSEPLLALQESVFDILSKAPNSQPPRWIER